jgi:hypothetical protein
MFITKRTLCRRTFLRGAGPAAALPLLDAMIPPFQETLGDSTGRLSPDPISV